MDKRREMIAGASRIFDLEGFRGVGIDRVIEPSGVSTRTLYKHFGSRDGLVLAVLEARHTSFMQQLAAQPEGHDPVGSLFDTLRQWMADHGARGCMLLRARSEYASASEAVVTLVQQQKQAFLEEVARRVGLAIGRYDESLALQIWLLFEGATASASVAPIAVIDEAKRAALLLVNLTRSNPA
ncbi:TetR/AcrR family transcriptional regulator [Pseudomonas sp. Marseille-QA0892]